MEPKRHRSPKWHGALRLCFTSLDTCYFVWRGLSVAVLCSSIATKTFSRDCESTRDPPVTLKQPFLTCLTHMYVLQFLVFEKVYLPANTFPTQRAVLNNVHQRDRETLLWMYIYVFLIYKWYLKCLPTLKKFQESWEPLQKTQENWQIFLQARPSKHDNNSQKHKQCDNNCSKYVIVSVEAHCSYFTSFNTKVILFTK